MIRFENVTKVFKSDLFTSPVKALDNVSFEIKDGAMVGFLGANGAGKTTSIKILLDFIRADSGKVHYGESIGGSLSKALGYIGFLPERPYFYPHLTGEEFASFMGELCGLNKHEVVNRSKYWAERLGIAHSMKRKLTTYSKGMLQRLGFLSVLIHNPRLIILDEPLSGLDPIGRKELKEVLREINSSGTTVFFSSHVVPDVEESCDDVVFLKTGKLVYQGSVDKIISQNQRSSFYVKIPHLLIPLKTQVLSKRQSGSDLIILEVSRENQNELIRELVQLSVPILGVEQARQTLEEVFYQIRSAE
jgi:ABC-2 type transport system ATP-binding protein